jgi:hypothetical protein
MGKAETAVSKTVAVVKQTAVGTAKQAGAMVSTAQGVVGQQATNVMDQAKDFVKKVGDSVGNVVDSITPGDANK